MNLPMNSLVDERACAAALGMSIGWIRKDRQGPRVLPFVKLGGAVRYDLERVRQTLAASELGGTAGARP